jgi:hypothetical protein
MQKNPSLLAKKAMQRLVENGGKSISRAMREAGYSPATAENPSKLTKTKSWKMLMDEYLPEDLVAETHRDLLKAEDTVFIPRGKEIIEKKRPDYQARKNGVEMAYKLRGSFATEKLEIKRTFSDMSGEELAKVIEEAKKKLLKK